MSKKGGLLAGLAFAAIVAIAAKASKQSNHGGEPEEKKPVQPVVSRPTKILKILMMGIGHWFAVTSIALTAINLIVIFLYITHGVNRAEVPIPTWGLVATIAALVLEIVMLFGDHVFTEFAGILAAAGNAYGFVSMMQAGLYNITDAVNKIDQFGDASVVMDNYIMTGLYLGAILFCVLACFCRKRKVVYVSVDD